MKFNFVKERLFHGKLKFIRTRDVAVGFSFRTIDTDMSDLVDPILIIAKQNNLNIAITENLVDGQKLLFFQYDKNDIVKALHILNVCTTLN